MDATTDAGGYGPGVNLFDLDPETSRHPQEMYRALRDIAPVLSLDGMGHMLTTREAAQECFRRPEVFSSAATQATLRDGHGAAAHPAADRPARPREVPEDPRPAVRAASHGRARGAGRRARARADRRLRRPRGVRLLDRVLGAAAIAGVPDPARAAALGPADVPDDEGRQ